MVNKKNWKTNEIIMNVVISNDRHMGDVDLMDQLLCFLKLFTKP